MMPCPESTGVDAHVICGVWLKIAVQVGPNAPVHCHNEFAMQKTAIFLVLYC
jgi:hypothetical protein